MAFHVLGRVGLVTTLCLAFAAAWLPDTATAQAPKKPLEPERKLRVLLFTGGSPREYQFLRSTLFRAMHDKRVDLCIHNQAGKEEVESDVERQLADFPDRLGPPDRKRPFMSLSEYDVVVAFDPDWLKLKEEQLALLRDWIDKHAGGFIFVAGSTNTPQLAVPRKDLNPIRTILPVVLKDSRLIEIEKGKPAFDTPYPLNFTRDGLKADFLKLAEDDASPTPGWNDFFWNDKDFKPNPAKLVEPQRGFYRYYPVEKLQPAATVLATLAGPQDTRINDGKDELPFIVTMRFGAGKTLYLGSGEFWRLREFRSGCFERIWLGTLAALSAKPAR